MPRALVAGLVVLDSLLCVVAFFAPEVWFTVFHGGGVVAEALPLLRRAGAQWLGFAMVQAVAFRASRTRPAWFLAVAAVRASDVFTDVVYATQTQVTVLGLALLIGAGVGNLAIALYLLRQSKLGFSDK